MEYIMVSAETAQLGNVLAFIAECAERAGMGMKAQSECALAAEEIFVNIANYAYEPDAGNVAVRIDACAEGLVVEFADSGRRYDPLGKEDPDITLTAADRVPGGLGIYMVKQLMDEVSYEYRDGQNVFTMRKAI